MLKLLVIVKKKCLLLGNNPYIQNIKEYFHSITILTKNFCFEIWRKVRLSASNYKSKHQKYNGYLLLGIAGYLIGFALIIMIINMFHKYSPISDIIIYTLLLLLTIFTICGSIQENRNLKEKKERIWRKSAFIFAIVLAIIIGSSTLLFILIFYFKQIYFSYVVAVFLFFFGSGLLILGLKKLELYNSIMDIYVLNKTEVQILCKEKNLKLFKPLFYGMMFGLITIAFTYIIIFLPLVIFSSIKYGHDPINVIFFGNLFDVSSKHGLFGQINFLIDNSDLSNTYALGLYYGIVPLVLVLVNMVKKRIDQAETYVASFGIITGFSLTIIFKCYITHEIPQTMIFASTLNFVYVLLYYLIVKVVSSQFIIKGTKEKLNFFFSGIEGLGILWILSKIFKDTYLVFTGLTFYVFFLLSSCLYELIFSKKIEGMKQLKKLFMKFKPSLKEAKMYLKAKDRELLLVFKIFVVVGIIFPIIMYYLLKLIL